jgi:hypothetical protein
MEAKGWISVKDEMPQEGQEVTVRMDHGQIRQVVRDKKYAGGWKQVNCTGWECVAFDSEAITHWRHEIFERPYRAGPEDAPWMTAKAGA